MGSGNESRLDNNYGDNPFMLEKISLPRMKISSQISCGFIEAGQPRLYKYIFFVNFYDNKNLSKFRLGLIRFDKV